MSHASVLLNDSSIIGSSTAFAKNIIDDEGVRVIAAGPTPLSTVAVTSDGSEVYTSDRRGNVYAFNMESGVYSRLLRMEIEAERIVQSHAHPEHLFCALTDTTIRAYDTSNGHMIESLTYHKKPIHSLHQSKDGSLLLSASSDSAALWATSSWSRERALGPTATSGDIVAATYMSDADFIAIAFQEGSIMVWNAANMGRVAKLVLPPEERVAEICSLAGSPDGTLLVAGARNGCLYLWDVPTGGLIRIIDMPAGSDGVKQLHVIHPSVAESIRVATGTQYPDTTESTLASESTNATALGMSAPQLVALGVSGHLLVVDLKPAQPAALLGIDNVLQEGVITAFTVSEDGSRLALLSDLGTLSVYDLPAAIIHHLQGQSGNVSELAASDSGHGQQQDDNEQHADQADETHESAASQPEADEGEESQLHGDQQTQGTSANEHETSSAQSDLESYDDSRVYSTFPRDDVPLSATGRDFADRMQTSKPTAAPSVAPTSKGAHSKAKHSQLRPAPAVKRSAPLHDLLARALVVPRLGPGADEYAQQKAKEVTVATHRKLRALLDLHGVLPSEYRALAWRFLLRLPGNVRCYDDLVARGEHAAWTNLAAQYPIRDRRLLERLSKYVNALSHWSPVFGELPFLPALVFPFVKFFGTDELSGFETVITVLLNWCSTFVECIPHPPVPLLARVHVLLSYWDAPLAGHLEACGADPSRYAWPILRSLFSEVLPRKEWEQLWDRLMVECHDPSYMIYVLVAYLRYIRGVLLAIEPSALGPKAHPGARQQQDRVAILPSGKVAFTGTQELAGFVTTPAIAEITAVVRNQNAVHLPSILKMATQMRQKTAAWAHPTLNVVQTPVTEDAGPLRAGGPVFPPAPAPEPAIFPICGAADNGPHHALPQDAYPPFLRYPRAVVDYAIAERNRIAAEEENLTRKKMLAEAMARRTAELAAEEEAWRLERKLTEAAEAKHSEELELLHALRAKEAELLETELRAQRVASIATMQEAARQALSTQRAQRSSVQARAEAERIRLARARDEMLRKRISEEALLSLELKAADRVRQLDEERDAEELEYFLQSTVHHKAKAEEMADQLLGEAWRLEDEERRVKRAASVRTADKVKGAVSKARMNAAQEMGGLVSKLERSSAISEIERERRLRHTAEDAAAASHEIAAALLEAENNVAAEALAKARREVECFESRVVQNKSTLKQRAAGVSAAAKDHIDQTVFDFQKRAAEDIAGIVQTRAGSLTAREQAAARAEERKLHDIGSKVTSGGSGVSTRVPDIAPQRMQPAYSDALLAAEAERVAGEAAEMGTRLVEREMEILRAEIQRAASLHGSIGRLSSDLRAVASEPAQRLHHPSRPVSARRPGTRGTSPSAPSSDVPPPPTLASEAAAAPEQRSVSRSSHQFSGVGFGNVVDGGSVQSTPSLGSRQRSLNTGSNSRLGAARRVPTSRAYRSEDESTSRLFAVDANLFKGRAGRLAAEASAAISGVQPARASGRHALQPRHPQRRSIRTSTSVDRRGNHSDVSAGYNSASSGSPLSQRPLDTD